MKKLLTILALVFAVCGYSQTSKVNVVKATGVKKVQAKKPYKQIQVIVPAGCQLSWGQNGSYCQCQSCTIYNVNYWNTGSGAVITGISVYGSCNTAFPSPCPPAMMPYNKPGEPTEDEIKDWIKWYIDNYVDGGTDLKKKTVK